MMEMVECVRCCLLMMIYKAKYVEKFKLYITQYYLIVQV